MPTSPLDKKVIETMNQILERELAGVVRYTHYSLMIYGYNRIPIVSWFRDQAKEALTHAEKAGELLTTYGDHPSLKIGPLLETHKHDIDSILKESLEAEREALELYKSLLNQVEGKHLVLEEYARNMIVAEEAHAAEVEKMLRKPANTK
ncbi:MAG TPA: ferritin-like domain-containing protein [bacterium]|nr:ferritin-like domain-containing protein [bacterium]